MSLNVSNVIILTLRNMLIQKEKEQSNSFDASLVRDRTADVAAFIQDQVWSVYIWYSRHKPGGAFKNDFRSRSESR